MTVTLDSNAGQRQGWEPKRIHVPRSDGSLLEIPPLSEAPNLVRENATMLQEARPNLQGRSLTQLREWSRQQALTAAADYTSTLIGRPVEVGEPATLVVGGHQPSLFHPGVWAKNFAIAGTAARTNGVAVNLVVDNDILSTSRIRVPAGSRDNPSFETVSFDDNRPRGPWQEAHVVNRELFARFGTTIAEKMWHWGIEPLASEIWPDAVSMLEQSTRLSDCFTAARARLERKWGLTNLELPMSRLCELDPFLWFASHIFAQLPRFRDIYNEALYEYRDVYGVRSRTHPVAELSENDGWIESPFRVWREGELQRKRLFAKQTGREVHLSDGQETFAKLPLAPEMEACCAVEALRELAAGGIRLRTRALTTTLFARLCLADLFVHGIGGSKYDEMTDRIIERFFGMPAPAFLTLSGTLHLPLAQPHNVVNEDLERVRRQLRDLNYNAERILTPGGEADDLIAEKRQLIAEQHAAQTTGLSRRERRSRSRVNYRRYRRFQELNRQLSAHASNERSRLEAELQLLTAEHNANAVLQDRDYSFCLYPEGKIRPFMAGIQSAFGSAES